MTYRLTNEDVSVLLEQTTPLAAQPLAQADGHGATRLAEEAAQGFRAVLDLHPEHSGKIHFLGLLLHERGRLGDALPRLQAAVCGAPDARDFRIDHLDALVAAGQYGLAWQVPTQVRARTCCAGRRSRR